jgi:hypothetical protein
MNMVPIGRCNPEKRIKKFDFANGTGDFNQSLKGVEYLLLSRKQNSEQAHKRMPGWCFCVFLNSCTNIY